MANFKGKCNKCKKKGHKASKCPEKGSGSGETAGAATTNDKTDVCSHCKKTGHKAESCWKKFPEKVLEWARELRTTKKPASTREAAGGTEVLVCSISIGSDNLDGGLESFGGTDGVMKNYGETDGDLSRELCELEMSDDKVISLNEEKGETSKRRRSRPSQKGYTMGFPIQFSISMIKMKNL